MTTTHHATQPAPDDFITAVAALTNAVQSANDGRGSDGAEIVAHVLATVAANLGSTAALIAARPGSWEADLVERLVRSTVGWDDDYLMAYRTAPIAVVVNPDEEFADLGVEAMYQGSLDHIVDIVTGGRWTGPAPAIDLTDEEAEQVDAADELLEALRERDTTHYEERFTEAVQAELERLRVTNPDRVPERISVAVRFVGFGTQEPELTDSWTPGLAGQLYQHARETTPLPGADAAPDWTGGKTPGEALLAAGHWPHLRVPELAHYGTPQPKDTDA